MISQNQETLVGMLQDAQHLPVPVLERLTQDDVPDCGYRLQQPTTIATRRIFIGNLLWFLRHRNLDACGPHELKPFFIYLQEGRREPGGLWGNLQLTGPVRPITIKGYSTDYFTNRTFALNAQRLVVAAARRV